MGHARFWSRCDAGAMPSTRADAALRAVCVSLFYVIDTGSTRPRASESCGRRRIFLDACQILAADQFGSKEINTVCEILIAGNFGNRGKSLALSNGARNASPLRLRLTVETFFENWFVGDLQICCHFQHKTGRPTSKQMVKTTVDPKTPRAEQDFGEFRMQFVGPGF